MSVAHLHAPIRTIFIRVPVVLLAPVQLALGNSFLAMLVTTAIPLLVTVITAITAYTKHVHTVPASILPSLPFPIIWYLPARHRWSAAYPIVAVVVAVVVVSNHSNKPNTNNDIIIVGHLEY